MSLPFSLSLLLPLSRHLVLDAERWCPALLPHFPPPAVSVNPILPTYRPASSYLDVEVVFGETKKKLWVQGLFVLCFAKGQRQELFYVPRRDNKHTKCCYSFPSFLSFPSFQL